MRKPRSINDAEREKSATRRARAQAAGRCQMCPSHLNGQSVQLCRACLDRRRAYLARLRGYRVTRQSRLKRLETVS
jgi:hypothetical protein